MATPVYLSICLSVLGYFTCCLKVGQQCPLVTPVPGIHQATRLGSVTHFLSFSSPADTLVGGVTALVSFYNMHTLHY